MSKKIFRSIWLIAISVLLASLIIVLVCMYSYFGSMQTDRLRNELTLATAAVENGGLPYLQSLKGTDCRITWIAADGAVLYDTQRDAATMENHAQREEVREALEHGVGESSRYSDTLTEKTSYYARQLSDGTVLRVSAGSATVLVLVLGILQPIVAVILLALLASALLARRMAKKIVEPLNALDLESPMENDAYEELSPLLTRLHQQRRQIDAQLRQLRQKTDEFEQVTAGMQEGLLLLGGDGAVLSINRAARRLFAVDTPCIGKPFVQIDRSAELQLAVQTAAQSGSATLQLERGGHSYQLDLSRIESNGAVIGTVLLSFDVTEQELAERSRREFTANVSHELKTPLQSIMGSAELLENGLVKAEDVPQFVGRIRSEAARLVTLINDIIRLSQLDEGEPQSAERVNLHTIAEDALSTLEAAAAQAEVSLIIEGGDVFVRGVPRLLYEIIYNLTDNAIRYNRAGGSIALRIDTENEEAVLQVRDTGIGISPEHQSRVFERFYRVDKSHSRASGGTGLGLSIVKHAVLYQKGSIMLESTEGKGSCFTVRLPLFRDAR